MFKLKFRMGNSAFDDGNKEYEVARILKEIAEKVENGRTEGSIMDYNGNNIGEWIIED